MNLVPLGRGALLALLAAGVAATHAAPSTAVEARRELNELRQKIEALQKRLDRSEATRGEAADALRASERAISEAGRRLHELANEAKEHKRQLDKIRAESQQVEQSVRQQQALLGNLLYQRYVSGGREGLRLLLNREDPNRIARHLHYFGHIARARVALVGELKKNLSRMRTLGSERERQLQQLETIAAAEAAEKRRLERERVSRSQVLAKMGREIKLQRRELGSLNRGEVRLTRLVEELGRAVGRKRPDTAPRNDRAPYASVGAGPFERLKGRLRLPVRGELNNRFGSPRPEGGAPWKGLFISAKAGEDVRAIAAGRVVFADWLRGFGNLLIIDHGGAYMSLYGNNEALYKRVGDAIRGGDPIARVGNSGGNADSGLYFELRHEGKPLDPLRWVDIQ